MARRGGVERSRGGDSLGEGWFVSQNPDFSSSRWASIVVLLVRKSNTMWPGPSRQWGRSKNR